MVPFLEKFFPTVLQHERGAKRTVYCVYDDHLLTAFTSSLYIAGFVATMLASRFTASYGRKFTMLLGGLTFLIGGALTGGAQHVSMLIVGRLFLGFGVGFNNQVINYRMASAKNVFDIYENTLFTYPEITAFMYIDPHAIDIIMKFMQSK